MELKKTLVVLVDDLDGTEEARTVRFGLDGKAYKIDLSERNEAKLRKFLAPYVDHARPDRKRKKRASGSRPKSRPSAAEVRAWAVTAGIEVAEKGRVPQEVIDQYESAQ